MKWLLTLFGVIEPPHPPCPHMWQEHAKHPVTSARLKSPIAYIYVLRCAACGDMKQMRVGA